MQEKKQKETSFVGTAEYVSPEVLLNKEAGTSSDLWAFGCILYQFFVGKPPFESKTEYWTFDAIIKGKYEFPENINPDAMDLCKQLLVVDPDQRLGSGPKDSPLSYEALKQHKFFKGINFDEVSKTKPIIDAEILSKLQAEKKVLAEEDDGINSEDEEFDEEELERTAKSSTTGAIRDEKKIFKEGIVLKKCGWLFYKKRKLVLNGKPRLSYYDPDNNEYKGDISLTKNTKAVKMSTTKFQIITSHRIYYLEGINAKDADQWIEMINTVINYFCSDNI